MINKVASLKRAVLEGNTIKITFPYDAKMIDHIKSLYKRAWNAGKKQWTAPPTLGTYRKLKNWGFELDSELERWYKTNVTEKPKQQTTASSSEIIAVLDNRYVGVSGSKKAMERLGDILSFKIQGSEYSYLVKYGKWDGRHKLLTIDQKDDDVMSGYFGLGLLDYVKENYDGKLKITDERVYTLVFDYKHLDNIDFRTEDGVSQLEGIEAALKHKTGIWHCATNFGKSRMAIGLLKGLSFTNDVPTAIFTHNDIIYHQLCDDVIKYCGEQHLGRIESGRFAPNMITIGMIPTISRNVKKGEYKTYLNTVKAYIIDEGHRGSSTTFLNVIDECENAEIRISMSGTPLYKDLLNNLKLIERTGEIIYTVRNETLIDKGISAKPLIKITSIENDYEYPYEYTRWPLIKKRYQYAVKTWIIDNEELNEQIVRDVIEELTKDSSIVIIVNRIQQAKNIQAILEDNDIDNLYIAGTEAKNKETLTKFRKRKKQVMIATPVMDEGVDIENINCMMLAGGGKSERQLLQRIGRGLRKKKKGSNVVTIYDYDVKDPIFITKKKIDGTMVEIERAYLQDQFDERVLIYEKENFEIINQNF